MSPGAGATPVPRAIAARLGCDPFSVERSVERRRTVLTLPQFGTGFSAPLPEPRTPGQAPREHFSKLSGQEASVKAGYPGAICHRRVEPCVPASVRLTDRCHDPVLVRRIDDPGAAG